MPRPPHGDTTGGIRKKPGATSKASRSTLAEKKKNLSLPIFTSFTDGPGSQRADLKRFGFSEPQIDALQEFARALCESRQPEQRRSIRKTKARAPLLDFLFPPAPRADKTLEAIAWIAALHAHKPAGLQHPCHWGLYSDAFVGTVQMCFEAAGLEFPKHALAQYQQQARRKREARMAALRM